MKLVIHKIPSQSGELGFVLLDDVEPYAHGYTKEGEIIFLHNEVKYNLTDKFSEGFAKKLQPHTETAESDKLRQVLLDFIKEIEE